METLVRGRFVVPVDKREVAKEWRELGYSCDLFVDPPGQQWNNFKHGCDELVVVVTGRLTMIIENDQWDMSPGDQIFIPRGALHSVHNTHTGSSHWLYGYN